MGWFAYAETGAFEKTSATASMSTVGIRVPVAYGKKQTGDVIGFEPLLPCVLNSTTDGLNQGVARYRRLFPEPPHPGEPSREYRCRQRQLLRVGTPGGGNRNVYRPRLVTGAEAGNCYGQVVFAV